MTKAVEFTKCVHTGFLSCTECGQPLSNGDHAEFILNFEKKKQKFALLCEGCKTKILGD